MRCDAPRRRPPARPRPWALAPAAGQPPDRRLRAFLIDTATGTLRLKGEFANADEILWPGEFVAVRLQIAMRKGAITVPERAVMQGAEGPYAYVIKADNTAERRPLEIEATEDGIAIVGTGIALGETVVVDGQYRLTAGSNVRIDQPAPGTPAPVKSAAPNKNG